MNRQPRRALRLFGPYSFVALALVGLAGALGLVGFVSTGAAGAQPQAFTVSPSSGPAGTVVSIRGTSCAPGPALSAEKDYVKIASTMAPKPVVVAVRRDGSWSSRFTVPADALVLPGLVAATCFTDGRVSPTTYVTHRFNVTSGATTAAGNAGRVAAVASGAGPHPTAVVPSTVGSDALSIGWLLLLGAGAAGVALLFWKRRRRARTETVIGDVVDLDADHGARPGRERRTGACDLSELTAIAERLRVIRDQRAERARLAPANQL